jgi:hypothetical protein
VEAVGCGKAIESGTKAHRDMPGDLEIVESIVSETESIEPPGPDCDQASDGDGGEETSEEEDRPRRCERRQ